MSNGRIILGAILILMGVGALTGFNVFRLIVPLLLIWWGFHVLTGRRSSFGETDSELHEDRLDEVLIFSGTNRKVLSSDFSGGRIVCVFGGAELDLSHVKAKEEIDLEVVAVFGGAKIKVPTNWEIRSQATAILGGVSNRTEKAKTTATKVKLTGAAVLGGVDIVN